MPKVTCNQRIIWFICYTKNMEICFSWIMIRFFRFGSALCLDCCLSWNHDSVNPFLTNHLFLPNSELGPIANYSSFLTQICYKIEIIISAQITFHLFFATLVWHDSSIRFLTKRAFDWKDMIRQLVFFCHKIRQFMIAFCCLYLWFEISN